ncbi:MAG: TetR/AcrR family transcriptional regulator [Bdellovibrionales bacterium]|nr:TetR/AcrR family transcriptional regulator [Bdellovibrionales bacterium]
MPDKSNNRKDEAFWKILSAAMGLDISKGHLKWNMAELSRKAKVTRSLIYYYFGQSKMDILNEAVNMIGEELVGLNEERDEMWRKGELLESLKASREVLKKAPFIPCFYLTHRADNNSSLGAALIQIEKRFVHKIRKFYPAVNETQAESLFAIYWGAAFSPGISEDALKGVLAVITSIARS